MSQKLARWLDDLIRIPGTRQGIGLDALVGLLPGIGDLAGSTFSGLIMYDAVQARVPVPVLARMSWNLLIDVFLGLVPGIGDLLDVAHRANRKNIQLLEHAVEKHPDPGPPSVGYLIAALVLTVTPLLIAVAVGLATLVLVVRWLSG